jgi:hypothetical protein
VDIPGVAAKDSLKCATEAQKAHLMDQITNRAREKREADADREHRRLYEAKLIKCRSYNVIACDAVIYSSFATSAERDSARSSMATAILFAQSQTDCRNGSASACDVALASPAADNTSRAELSRRRSEISSLNRAAAATLSFGRWANASIKELPSSTLVVGAIAAVLAVLVAILSRRSRTAPPLPRAVEAPSIAERYKLGHLLMKIGWAGVFGSVLWWLVFYMRVNQFMGGTASDMKHAVRCLFSSSGPCGFIQGIANAAGAFAYEPIALWISGAILLTGLILRGASR